ncbi:MAG: hypothetical protein KAX46_05375, partial [Chromatiaceae bacterium]|nr:hypothetical protein [Chromatiaceae bacterium]
RMRVSLQASCISVRWKWPAARGRCGDDGGSERERGCSCRLRMGMVARTPRIPHRGIVTVKYATVNGTAQGRQ